MLHLGWHSLAIAALHLQATLQAARAASALGVAGMLQPAVPERQASHSASYDSLDDFLSEVRSRCLCPAPP